jgi:hypothetical protein
MQLRPTDEGCVRNAAAATPGGEGAVAHRLTHFRNDFKDRKHAVIISSIAIDP